MQSSHETTIIEKDNGISSILIVQYSYLNPNITWGMNNIIHEITKQFDIDPEKIDSINVTKNNYIRKLQIEFSK